MFSKLAGWWQETQLATNPPAHPLSKLLAKVINFTVIDLNIAQEEEKMREKMPLQMLRVMCSHFFCCIISIRVHSLLAVLQTQVRNCCRVSPSSGVTLGSCARSPAAPSAPTPSQSPYKRVCKDLLLWQSTCLQQFASDQVAPSTKHGHIRLWKVAMEKHRARPLAMSHSRGVIPDNNLPEMSALVVEWGIL